MPRLSKIGAACLRAFGWSGSSTVTAKALVVGGGGGGGVFGGGGGGAGAIVYSESLSLDPTLSYTVVVGAGGTRASMNTSGGSSTLITATSGSNSSISTLTATGGGFGASYNSATVGPASGGSGGGFGGTNAGTGASATGSSGGSTDAVSGANGWGNSGGNTGSLNGGGGGGGGAGSAGVSSSGTNNTAGAGGAGLQYTISGTSTYYAGGGGGGGYGVSSGGGAGGAGGGGAGGPSADTNGVSGTANLGGGGGGQTSNGANAVYYSGAGGSGVVIISYAGAQQFGGGVVTYVGGNTIHTFTTSGTLSPLNSLTASYLIVGGGGGTVRGASEGSGGGGAGGLLSGSGMTIDTNSTYLVTVGAGGAASSSTVSRGNNGSNSSFSLVSTSAVGGGGGGQGSSSSGTGPGASGGSGGGGGYYGASGGAGTAGQGNNGGNGKNNPSGPYSGGGGGGAGAIGTDATATGAGNGGIGISSSISGTATYYAGGGGGGSYNGTLGTGGNGGGGNGSANTTAPTAGTANTGGGGGGGNGNYDGTAGGSGIVIISYPGSTQQMAGGTVTIVGGNVIHTFNSTGYLSPLTYVGNSLRFRGSATAYLTRTPMATATSNQKFTISFWAKISLKTTSNGEAWFFDCYNQNFGMYFNSQSRIPLQLATGAGYYVPTQVARDPAAWYHFVIAVDTTQATGSNRIRYYVNGVEITAWNTQNIPAQNTTYNWNQAGIAHYIGTNSNDTTRSFDGQLAEFRSIDGQQLAPTAFGTFNQYGVWQPINYGGSYGTNGFYLPFTAGTSSYAGYFNGSNQKLNTVSGPTNYGTGDFTFECWINPDSVGTYLPLMATATTGAAWIGKNGTNFVLRAFSVADLLSTPNQPVAGVWTHIAVTRSGSTAYIFFNGVLQVSGTVTQNFASGVTWLGTDSGSLYYAGYMNNVRSIIGTALYTSNFTPPATPLTAVSGTALLTLQDSSIVDNSTNAYTITNTNGVTTGQTYPFSAAKIFNDQSPQQNNWTPNNISGGFGPTLDYMTDVPTLTSATASNYCVLNPLSTLNSPTISQGNLYGSMPNDSVVASTMAVSAGKWYWETIRQSDSGNGMMAGVSKLNPSTGQFLSDYRTAYGYAYWAYNGYKYNNGTGTAYGATYVNGDVIGVALDLDGGTLTFYKNGVSQGTAFTGLSGTFMPNLQNAGGGASYTATINFGQQPFAYTPPSGFVAINTFNM